jgi:hypothetical protein
VERAGVGCSLDPILIGRRGPGRGTREIGVIVTSAHELASNFNMMRPRREYRARRSQGARQPQ